MFPEELMSIIYKYKSNNQSQIQNIYDNLCEIILSLKRIRDNIASDLYEMLASDDITDTSDIINDINKLKEQILYIQSFTSKESSTAKKTIPDIDIYTIIVLSNTLKCSSSHNIIDIVAKLPVLNEHGEISYINKNASYCSTCNRFTILKEDFNTIKDVIMCKVIDETISYYENNCSSDMEIMQKNSILSQYGYNVQARKDLSEQQRHIILSSIIEAQILTRREVIDHITTLIDRGSKIPNWKSATQKWKDDRQFVSEYHSDSLPEVIFNSIILKYKK